MPGPYTHNYITYNALSYLV